MTKIRLTQLGGLALLLAWYASSALPASATPDPPPGYYATPGPPLPAEPPAQPVVIHDHIAIWNYALIVGLTVIRHPHRRCARRSGAPAARPARRRPTGA